MDYNTVAERLRLLAMEYNSPEYFITDPISIPKHFFLLYKNEEATLQDIEISAVIAAHLAWGRRDMIVRDCRRAMDEMRWNPYCYVMKGEYRREDKSLHRTIKWSEFALICERLKDFYSKEKSLESLSPDEIRERIYGKKSDKNAANKKIHMLIIPLDVHVHRSALELEITKRKSADIRTAVEITDFLTKVFPDDPCLGDFALFAYAASRKK
ncbi:MAG: hypothetical protein H6Q22_1745 [Bacteroidetes bacterium]|nr:hypothetical protein [Bacteroidota bacterium]